MLYRFDNIEKSYGPHDIVKGATWQHNPGEKVGLVGRNGAGKTTLFRLLLERGASPNDKDGKGKQVHQAATSEWIRALLAEGSG